MKKYLGILSVLSFSACGGTNQASTVKSEAGNVSASMSCFEADHGIMLAIDQGQSGISAKVSELTVARETELASFASVQNKVFNDTLVPTQAFGGVNIDSGDMFYINMTDPSANGLWRGQLSLVVKGELMKKDVRCRMVD